MSWTVQVLQSNNSSLNTGDLRVDGVVKREGDLDAGVVDRNSGLNVGIDGLVESVLIGRASARDLDRFAISAVDGTITITSSCWVLTRSKAK